MSGGQESFGSAYVHVGERARVDCHADGRAAPILSVQAGRVTVNISIADHTAMPAYAVAFARDLAAEAAAFAAECERLHAAEQGQAPVTAAEDAA